MTEKHLPVAEERRSYADLEADIADLRGAVEELTKSISALVTAWETAKGITSFVKWVGSLSTGATILWALFHGGISK